MADDNAHRIIQRGAEIAGASVGFAIELLGATMPGSGAVMGAVVASVLDEIGSRSLSVREQTRIGATFNFAAGRISARIMHGDLLRSDGFFDHQPGDRAPSVALLEGVLLKARDEFEEKKLRHLGSFYANLAFVADVSPSTAYLLLKQIDRMSYRQLAVLALIGRRGSYDLERLQRPEHADAEMEALKREVVDLHGNPLGTMGLLWPKDSLYGVFLGPLGRAMVELAALDEIPVEVTTQLDGLIVKPAGWKPPPERIKLGGP